MIRIEIEQRLEHHERHAVEPDGVVLEPAPGEARVLPAAEPVLLGPGGIRVVEIRVDRRPPFRDFCGPVVDDLAVNPRHDLIARVLLEWTDESALGHDNPLGLTIVGRGPATSEERDRHDRNREAPGIP